MTAHHLKIHPQFFRHLADGRKTFEVRVNDRTPPFAVGDILVLEEWDPSVAPKSTRPKEPWGYTGRAIRRRVTYLTDLSVVGRPDLVAMQLSGDLSRGPGPAPDLPEQDDAAWEAAYQVADRALGNPDGWTGLGASGRIRLLKIREEIAQAVIDILHRRGSDG